MSASEWWWRLVGVQHISGGRGKGTSEALCLCRCVSSIYTPEAPRRERSTSLLNAFAYRLAAWQPRQCVIALWGPTHQALCVLVNSDYFDRRRLEKEWLLDCCRRRTPCTGCAAAREDRGGTAFCPSPRRNRAASLLPWRQGENTEFHKHGVSPAHPTGPDPRQD